MDKCYNHDYHDPCQPDRPVPRPGDPCCHPDMPGPDPFAPCDKPGFAPPPKPFIPMQPVPSVCEGASLYEAVNILTQRVNVCMDTYNHVMAENYRTLHNLQRAAEENGAYYGPREVWVEEGYCADESATYHLVHKGVVDRRGEPIRMELHLAYGNTTNSQIEQDIFSASKVTFADKIFVAQPKGENGWYGRAIWKGCPIASSDSTELYTVGFTKSGHMRVYQNAVSVDQMLRDTIENAMGCSGILIQNGQLCDDSYITSIPNWDKQVERVIMGQNLDTKEVIFLVCGDEDDVHRKGITSKAAAKILLAYGCDIAVELCEGTDAGAADKGSLMLVPKENKVPTAYAYWVISRRCFYRTDYERELAELIQNYGHCLWDGYLNKKRIEQVKAELDQEILDRIAGDKQLQDNLDEETRQRIEADRVLQENIDKETERAKAEEARIEGRLDDEIERATAEEKRIDAKLDSEIERAKSEEQRIEGKLDDEIARAKSEESRIETKLDNEIERSTTEDKRLDDKIDQEIHDRTNEDAKLHQEILTEQGERIAADKVLQTNINNEAATRASEDERITDLLTDKINQEQTERIAADNTLQSNIDKEAATRASEDTRVTEEMTALITAETNARTEADKTLQSNIDKEASTRASEDVRVSKELTALINAEVENRTNADTALGARIDALTVRVTATEADIVKLQDLTVKLQQQMTALDTSVTEILHTISDIETALNNVKVSITNLTNTVNQIIDGTIELPYVKKAGDTMTGPLQMADGNGTVKGSLSAADDGVSIAAADGTFVKAGGDLVSVGGNDGKDVVVRGVADPVNGNDAVNKDYVDGINGIKHIDVLATAIKVPLGTANTVGWCVDGYSFDFTNLPAWTVTNSPIGLPQFFETLSCYYASSIGDEKPSDYTLDNDSPNVKKWKLVASSDIEFVYVNNTDDAGYALNTGVLVIINYSPSSPTPSEGDKLWFRIYYAEGVGANPALYYNTYTPS